MAEQIVNQPFLYVNNFPIAVASNTTLTVGAGICRDSTNTFDMELTSTITINAAANGLNGLDTGTFAASKVYAVYVITDPYSGNPAGAMISLSLTAPTMPFGYGAFRLVGYAITDSSIHFLPAYIAGNNNYRQFVFDAPQATAVTAGNATSYTAVNLSALVPAVDNTPVSIAYAFTPGAASRTFNLTPGNATGNALTITGQVTSVVVSNLATVMAKVTAGIPEVDYKVANSGDAVAINVAGFNYFI